MDSVVYKQVPYGIQQRIGPEANLVSVMMADDKTMKTTVNTFCFTRIRHGEEN